MKIPVKNVDLYENILTTQDVETVINKSLGSDVKIISYSVELYSDKTIGFAGVHKKLNVKISRDSTANERHTYFLKCMPYDMGRFMEFVQENRIFDKEVNFYKLIMPELMKSTKDKSWAAQCYLTKNDALVLENLKIKNYTLLDGDFLDVKSLKAALGSLAKMHAASLLAEKRLGKTFLEIYPEIMYESLFRQEGAPSNATNFQSRIDLSTTVAKKLGLDHTVVPQMYHLLYEKVLPSKCRKNVICHGDTHKNNLMFNDSNCALVDFQIMRYAPPMVDVSQLIYLNARKEVREEHEMQFLRYYHQILCHTLKTGGMDVPLFNDILEEYEEMKIIGVMVMNSYFPIIHVNKEKVLEVTKDHDENSDDLLFENRVVLAMKLMEVDENYHELLTSNVRELVDVSKQYL